MLVAITASSQAEQKAGNEAVIVRNRQEPAQRIAFRWEARDLLPEEARAR